MKTDAVQQREIEPVSVDDPMHAEANIKAQVGIGIDIDQAADQLGCEQDQSWMQLAFEQAAQAAHAGEVPVGAVIVSQGQIIGQGYNCPIESHDPTAHAEIQALRQACQRAQNYRLPEDATLYVTLEPCTMCVGALIHARVARVVFATTEPKAGALVSARKLLDSGYYNHSFAFEGGCLQAQCAAQLSQFFKMRREQKKQQRLAQKQFNAAP